LYICSALLDWYTFKLFVGILLRYHLHSFFKNIEKLQVRKDSFDCFMKGTVQPNPHPDSGLANLYFWRELYLLSSRCFKEVLTAPATE
jgi:hypothetical protein